MDPLNFAQICIKITTSSSLLDKLDVVIFDEISNSEKVVEVKVEF